MKKIMEVKKLINLGLLLTLLGTSWHAMAFRCSTDNGPFEEQGNQDINVTMTPSIQQNYNLIIDLSQKIICYNDDAGGVNFDWTSIAQPSEIFSLSGFNKYIIFDGKTYSSPLMQETLPFGFAPGKIRTPLPLSFVISPINNAGGQVIMAGEKVARLTMYKRYPLPTGPAQSTFIWNIFSNTEVIIPIGGCDVSARNVNVVLPEYDGTTQTVAVPLTVNCPGGNKQLYYTLSGATHSSSNTIFRNVAASNSPASGIGIKILDRNNNVIAANNQVYLGVVGISPVNLELKAAYAKTGEPVSAGPVQSIIEVAFTYL